MSLPGHAQKRSYLVRGSSILLLGLQLLSGTNYYEELNYKNVEVKRVSEI